MICSESRLYTAPLWAERMTQLEKHLQASVAGSPPQHHGEVLSVVVLTCNPSPGQIEAGGAGVSGLPQMTWSVPGQQESLSQKG